MLSLVKKWERHESISLLYPILSGVLFAFNITLTLSHSCDVSLGPVVCGAVLAVLVRGRCRHVFFRDGKRMLIKMHKIFIIRYICYILIFILFIRILRIILCML